MPFEIQEEEDCLVLRLYGVLTSEDLQWAGLEIARGSRPAPLRRTG